VLRIQSGSFQVGSDRYAIDYRSRSSRRRRRDVDDTTGHVVIKRDASQPLDVDKPSGTTHTHPFNGHFSGTTRVSRYQKGKTSLDFTEARDSEWQWHQLGRMQVCTSLQTDNHASTPPLSFIQAGCPCCHPTNSVKAARQVLPKS